MSDSETKQCQSCKQNFTIDAEDFDFYQKIDVPPPTWCPECRVKRRLSFRDYRVLYKRKDDRTGETIFSIFNPKSQCKVWDREYWWSDNWDALDYGMDVDFSKPFFEQIKELFRNVPMPSQSTWNLTNSDYAAGSNNLKNCYLTFVATSNEDCAYAAEINQTKRSFDVTRLESSELCFDSFALTKCYQTFFSSHCENCVDVWFSRNLIGCSECFGCINLNNKKNNIFNQQYSKEEYDKKIKEFNVGSYSNLLKIKSEVSKIFAMNIRRCFEGRHNADVSGEYINNSKNVHESYYVTGSEDCKYIQSFFTPGSRDCYDCTLWGENVERIYECSSIGDDSYNIKFGFRCYKGAKNCEYSIMSVGCSDIFGCVGLRNKQYCILNKQYDEASFKEMRAKIIQHMNDMPYMDKMGRVYKYGEFFPVELSPFGYNESAAQDYFPLSKEEAEMEGYAWAERESVEYQCTIKAEDLPDDIKNVDNNIINEVIECAHNRECDHSCIGAFKIIPQELEFYKSFGIPLPRLCHNCRHYERIRSRNSMKLWHRSCQCGGLQSANKIYTNTVSHSHGSAPCPNEFQTSYDPSRPEIVYCEECYQKEVS